MSEPSSIPHVTTTAKPFGVSVEWKWPGGCAVLELQYLHEDGRLVKELIRWPSTGYLISGLKAGERLQVRLRPVAADGPTRDWLAADWVEGVSSVDAGEILQAVQDEIRSSDPFKLLHGECFIKEASLDAGKLSANYSVKLGTNHGGKHYPAGMGIVVNNAATEMRLSDQMQQAVIKAVRESDLFTSLQSGLNAQAASIAALQQATHDAVNDAIRNALKPGGAIWAAHRR